MMPSGMRLNQSAEERKRVFPGENHFVRARVKEGLEVRLQSRSACHNLPGPPVEPALQTEQEAFAVAHEVASSDADAVPRFRFSDLQAVQHLPVQVREIEAGSRGEQHGSPKPAVDLQIGRASRRERG